MIRGAGWARTGATRPELVARQKEEGRADGAIASGGGIVALAMIGLIGLAPNSLASEAVDGGAWDSSSASVTCGAGTNSRTCSIHVDVNSSECKEVSSTDIGSIHLFWIGCQVSLDAQVRVQPELSAAGRVIGCTSVAGRGSGSATYESGISADFSRSASNPISLTAVTVHGTRADQSDALVTYEGFATSDDGLNSWSIQGTISGVRCGPSTSSESRVSSGSVTVSVNSTS